MRVRVDRHQCTLGQDGDGDGDGRVREICPNLTKSLNAHFILKIQIAENETNDHIFYSIYLI